MIPAPEGECSCWTDQEPCDYCYAMMQWAHYVLYPYEWDEDGKEREQLYEDDQEL